MLKQPFWDPKGVNRRIWCPSKKSSNKNTCSRLHSQKQCTNFWANHSTRTHLFFFLRSLTLATRAIWSPHYLKTPQQKAAMIQQLTLKISFASLLQGQNLWYAQVKSNRPLSRKIILLIEGRWHWGGVQLDCHESWWNGISPTWTSLTSGEFSFNSLPVPFFKGGIVNLLHQRKLPNQPRLFLPIMSLTNINITLYTDTKIHFKHELNSLHSFKMLLSAKKAGNSQSGHQSS